MIHVVVQPPQLVSVYNHRIIPVDRSLEMEVVFAKKGMPQIGG